MSTVDDAISRIQALADAVTAQSIKFTPDYPPETATVLPASVAFLGPSRVERNDASGILEFYDIYVDIHVDRTSAKEAYRQTNLITPEMLRRFGGDPTLADVITTIVYPVTAEEPRAVLWGEVPTLMTRFIVPVKYRNTPTSTST